METQLADVDGRDVYGCDLADAREDRKRKERRLDCVAEAGGPVGTKATKGVSRRPRDGKGDSGCGEEAELN